MPSFNYKAAKDAGYSDDEIAKYLQEQNDSGADLYIDKNEYQQATQVAEQPKEKSFIEKASEVVPNLAVGAAKGVASTVAGAASLGEKVITRPIDKLVTGKSETGPTFGEQVQEKYLQGTNTAQKIGKGVEQVAEYLIPGTAGFKVGKAASTAAKGGKIVKAAARIGSEVAAEGAIGGGVAAVQSGGDVRETVRNAALSASAPLVLRAAVGGYRVGKGIVKGVKELINPDVEVALMKAIKPKASKVTFSKDLNTALPDIYETAQMSGRDFSKSADPIGDLNQTILETKKRVWATYEDLKAPNATAEIDGNHIADEMVSAMDDRFKRQNPAKAARIEEVANTYRRTLTLDEAEEALQSANNDLHSYYAKNKVGRKVAEADPETGYIVKEADGLRRQLYSKINELTGTDAAALKRRYGALSSVQEEVQARAIVTARQAPTNLAENLSYASGAAKIVTGDIKGGAAQIVSTRYLKKQATADELIKKAFAKMGEKPPASYPKPPNQYQRAITAAGGKPPVPLLPAPKGIGFSTVTQKRKGGNLNSITTITDREGNKIGKMSFTQHQDGDTIFINYIESSEQKKGVGTNVIKKLFNDNPKIQTIRAEADEAASKFWEKIGAKTDRVAGRFDEVEYELSRGSFFKALKEKEISNTPIILPAMSESSRQAAIDSSGIIKGGEPAIGKGTPVQIREGQRALPPPRTILPEKSPSTRSLDIKKSDESLRVLEPKKFSYKEPKSGKFARGYSSEGKNPETKQKSKEIKLFRGGEDNGFSYSTDSKVSKNFAKKGNGQFKEFTVSPDAKIASPSIVRKLMKGIDAKLEKMFEKGGPPEVDWHLNEARRQLKKLGYDGADFSEYNSSEKEFLVWNKKILSEKSKKAFGLIPAAGVPALGMQNRERSLENVPIKKQDKALKQKEKAMSKELRSYLTSSLFKEEANTKLNEMLRRKKYSAARDFVKNQLEKITRQTEDTPVSQEYYQRLLNKFNKRFSAKERSL